MLDSIACVLVRCVSGFLCRLPPRTCVRLGQTLGDLAYWCSPKRVRIGYLNLMTAYGARMSPRQAHRVLHRLYRNLGATLVEMLRLPALDAAYVTRYVEVVGREHIERARDTGRPVLFLTGHFGNWEMTSIVGALIGYPIVALARAQDKLPKLYRLLVSYRESKGCRIVHKGGAMRQLLRALQARQMVGIVGDQASRHGRLANFFGRPALFATGPFELARTSQAIILPAFMHRRRGPFHRLVIEPPIDLSQRSGSPEAVVQAGIERFAEVLCAHIEQDSDQWLWVHKRWKHTPQRRIAIISDGKLGHVKQSLVVAAMLKERVPEAVEQVVEVRYRHRLGRWLAVAWAGWGWRGAGELTVLRWVLEPVSFRHLTSITADVVISCGAAAAPVNALFSALNRARSVVIMNPVPLPLSRFSLALIPEHDRVRGRVRPRANVVRTAGALSGIRPELLEAARRHLMEHPRFHRRATWPARMVVSLFIGGDTPTVAFNAPFAARVAEEVLAVCEALEAACLVTTSRRTPEAVARVLEERFAAHPRCPLFLAAGRDSLNGTLEGMLGWADLAVVTSDSVSMVSEAWASGRPVVVVDAPTRAGGRRARKTDRFLSALARQGHVRLSTVGELRTAIRQSLHDAPAPQADAPAALLREAVARLL